MVRYIDTLQTRESGASEPLAMYAARTVEESRDESVDRGYEVGDKLARVVSRSLRYKKDALITPTEVAREQATNCYGYTVVLSELLAVSGIRHHIAFANQHAFVMVTGNGDGGRPAQYLIDPLTPHLNGNVTDLVAPSEQIEQAIDVRKVGATRLDAYSYVNNRTQYGGGYDQAAEKHKWLKFGGEFSHVHDDERRRMRDARLLTNIYSPIVGVEVLEDYSGFLDVTHSSQGDVAKGMEHLGRLAGIFPDIDYRNKFSDINKFIQKLAGSPYGTTEAIEEVIEGFDSSLEPHKEASRVREWKPDTYRKIGAHIRRIELVDKAIMLYEGQSSRHGSEKLAKARQVRRRLSLE